MKVQTSRFGEIDVKEDRVFVFPEGILGFSSLSKYTFLQEEGSEPFRILQSLENPSLAFVVIDPMTIRSDYTVEVTEELLETIEAEKVEDLVVYVIVTMASKIENTTMNLQGPLIINPKKRICTQYVIYDDKYSTKEPLLKQEEGSKLSKVM